MKLRGGVFLCACLLALAPAACFAGDRSPGPPTSSLVNGGFDDPTQDPSSPPGWGSQGSAYGSAQIVERAGASGGKAVELAPSARGSSGAQSFMLYEVLDSGVFRGKKVEYGARVATEGAGVNLVVWSPEGSGNDFVSDVNHPEFMERKNSFTVPANASLVTFGVQVLGPGGGRAWVDDVYVRLAGSPEAAPPASAPTTSAPTESKARVRIRANSVVRDLPPDFFAMHIEWMEDASGLVEPGTGTPRPEVVELLKPLRIPLLRFPGGIGADFYDWRKGVGPQGGRGEIRNPFSKKMEKVAFGSPEFIDFAKTLNAQACISANYGTGSPADAGAWAQWFVQQGFVPKCWEVGNEIYLSGPKATGPNSKDIFKPGAQYAKDFPGYASAIKAAIQDAKVGAIAHLDTGAFPLADGGNPNWTLEMLDALSSKVDFFALHNGYAPVVIDDSIDLSREEDRQKMYRAMFAAPLQTKENLAAVAQAVRQRSPANEATPFAITEFGTLVGISGDTKRFLSYVDHSRTQASALYIASLLSVYIADPRVVVTMYTNPVHKYYGDLVLVDASGLVTSPSYYLYRFYRERFASRIVATETSSPVFSSETVGLVKATSEVPSLLASASKSADGKRLTALLVNRGLLGPLDVEASLEGFTPAKVSCELLAAPPNAINGPSLTATVLKNSDVKPKPFPCENTPSQHLTLPPCSILSLVAEAS